MPQPPPPFYPTGSEKPWYKKRWGIAVIVLGVLAVIGAMSDDSPTATQTAGTTQSPTVSTPPTAPAPSTPAPSAPTSRLSSEQRNAVRAAENYLSVMAFSRSGLIDQLQFEGYSRNDATVAVDEIDPDWRAQAAAAARQYLSVMPFSRSALIDQLVFDGFSRAEAEFGVASIG
jgi:pyruvate/2-oxoglutarate dehydrogenase complex dihydrolipoamide acyltransferase (E2) component